MTKPVAWSLFCLLDPWLLLFISSPASSVSQGILMKPDGCSSASLAYLVPFNSHAQDAQGGRHCHHQHSVCKPGPSHWKEEWFQRWISWYGEVARGYSTCCLSVEAWVNIPRTYVLKPRCDMSVTLVLEVQSKMDPQNSQSHKTASLIGDRQADTWHWSQASICAHSKGGPREEGRKDPFPDVLASV